MTRRYVSWRWQLLYIAAAVGSWFVQPIERALLDPLPLSDGLRVLLATSAAVVIGVLLLAIHRRYFA